MDPLRIHEGVGQIAVHCILLLQILLKSQGNVNPGSSWKFGPKEINQKEAPTPILQEDPKIAFHLNFPPWLPQSRIESIHHDQGIELR